MLAEIQLGTQKGDYCHYLRVAHPDTEAPLFVVSAGYGPERLTPKRVFIRNCFVFHFVVEGHGRYNGEAFGPGDVLLSTPLVPEIREFSKGEFLNCAWIRVEGNGVADLLRKSSIAVDTQVIRFKKCKEAVDIIKETIHTPCEESSLGYALLGAFFRIFSLFPRKKPAMAQTDSVVDRAVHFIQGHYHQSLSIACLAKQVNVSAGHLCRLFKQHFSLSVMGYITEYRMKCARLLLSDTGLKVHEIAETVGFKDARYFSHAFTEKMGISPLAYRKNPENALSCVPGL